MNKTGDVRVVLFEDNRSLRNSLSMVLGNTRGLNFTGAFENANDAVARIQSHRPDVVIMDIQMPGVSGLEALRLIRARFPEVRVLIQTVFEDDHRIFTAICNGASGYVLKNPDTEALVRAIFEVNAGGSHLSPTIAARVLKMFQNQQVTSQPAFVDMTPREKEVLGYMVKGMSYKMIADACSLSVHTVHWHLKNIYEKLHVNSAPEAVAKAIEQRII